MKKIKMESVVKNISKNLKKLRLEKGPLLPTRDNYQGAARLETATVEEMARKKEETARLANGQ
jgi:hypothetical protein